MSRKGSRTRILVVAGLLIAGMLLATAMPVSAYTYNRQAAVNYAIANWDKNVEGSWYFKLRGGDCTNFVSWSVYNGGWPMVRSGSNSQLWYYTTYMQHSNSWTVANDFGKFITYSGRGQGFTLTPNPPWKQFKIGDIIQIDYGKDFATDHTLIITGITSNDILVTSHSRNRKDYSLIKLMNENPTARFVGYQLYDQFVW